MYSNSSLLNKTYESRLRVAFLFERLFKNSVDKSYYSEYSEHMNKCTYVSGKGVYIWQK